MRVLTLGRFQPFHLGHLHLIKQVLSEYDEVIIAITSSQFNYIEKDPFTAGERIQMIRQSLRDEKIDLARCIIIPIENQPNISTWASYLKSMLPKFDAVISGNKYVTMLLGDSGIKVIEPEFLDRNKFNASKIRHMMVQDNSWEGFVPKAVADMVEQTGGIARLKTISDSDTNPVEH